MSAIIKHLVPSTKLGYQRFIDDKNFFIAILIQKFDELFSYKNSNFNPYPIIMNNKLLDQVNHSHRLLVEAIKQIVKNYLADKDIQAIINLPTEVIRWLQLINDKDYEIGTIRPDFLIDENGDLKICEINARFPTNGFIMSQRLNEAVSYQEFGSNLEPINENRKIIKLISNFFDLHKPISILKDKEKGYDIHFLKNDLKKLCDKAIIHIVSPQQLSLDKTGIYNGIAHCNQFILELNQEELLNMKTDILKEIVTNSRYFNDIRTIFIAHDKRLLSVLRNKAIMQRYLSPKQFYQLQDYITPTYILNNELRKSIKNNPTNWVLKKHCGGKGEGMYVGKDNDLTELENIFNEQENYYLAQPYIEQYLFKIWSDSEDKKCGYQNMRLVGMILSFNENLLGAGFFRGSCGNIVNVSRYGGTILTPLRQKNNGKKN